MEDFSSFGELLKYLRTRAQMTQRELAIAVGYSEAQISRLESSSRPPNVDAVRALFIPALDLEDEPQLAASLIELARSAAGPAASTEPQPRDKPRQSAHNLPFELTSLVGRVAELAEIEHILEQPIARLLTLTGSGGCGKTRLALRTARITAGRFQHGVYLVELAPLSDPQLVTQAVIAAYGLVPEPNQPELNTLLAFLRTRETLLILDNCEHVIDAASALALALLRACPDLKILATSREPLDIPGEAVFKVPSLILPPEDWDGTPKRSAAVELFLERASLVQQGFTLAQGDAAAVAQICRRLDGIPLAIELAAARASALPLSLIASRLEEGFAVLGSSGRGVDSRHATLQAAVAWSYDLLSEPERVLLRRLPFFAGGWRLEQAEEICSCNGVERAEVLDLLAALVRKSLVNAERLPDGSMRYHLHEMVRQFARERLVEAGEADTLRNCFVDYFVRLAEQAEPLLKGPRQLEWLRRLDQDQDNLVEALEMAFQHKEALPALRLTGALAYYWLLKDRDQQGRRWLESSLRLVETLPEQLENRQALQSARAKAIEGILFPELYHGSPVTKALALECVSIRAALGDERGRAFARSFIWTQEDPDGWKSDLLSSLPAIEQAGDHWTAGWILYSLGQRERGNGNFAAGRVLTEASETHFRASGDRFLLAFSLGTSCWLYWDKGAVRKGHGLLVEALRVLTDYDAWDVKAVNSIAKAHFETALGRFEEAQASLEFGLRALEAIGAFWELPYAYHKLGRCAFLEGRLDEAHRYIAQSLDRPIHKHTAFGTGEAMVWLGLIHLYQGRAGQSAQLLEPAMTIFENDVRHEIMHHALRALGKLRLAQGDLAAARGLLDHALAEISHNSTLPDFPETLDLLAQLALAEEIPERAARMLGASNGLLERMEIERYPVYQPEYQRCRDAAFAALGDAAFEQAYAAGRQAAVSEDVIAAVNALC